MQDKVVVMETGNKNATKDAEVKPNMKNTEDSNNLIIAAVKTTIHNVGAAIQFPGDHFKGTLGDLVISIWC